MQLMYAVRVCVYFGMLHNDDMDLCGTECECANRLSTKETAINFHMVQGVASMLIHEYLILCSIVQ